MRIQFGVARVPKMATRPTSKALDSQSRLKSPPAKFCRACNARKQTTASQRPRFRSQGLPRPQGRATVDASSKQSLPTEMTHEARQQQEMYELCRPAIPAAGSKI